PYNKHKLQPRSLPSTFIGFSSQHKGYKILLPSGKVIVTRDVIFDESLFPFSKPTPTHSNLDQLQSFLNQPPSIVYSPTSANPSSNPHISTPPHSSSTISPTPVQNNSQHSSPSSASSSTQSNNSSHSTVPLYVDLPIVRENTSESTVPTNNNAAKHHMITRSKTGSLKPRIISAQLTQEEPSSYKEAFTQPAWKAAMMSEYQALLQNNTWSLVSPAPNRSIIGCKWLFKLKRHADGRVARHKARLVAKGFSETAGIDFYETFSPVLLKLFPNMLPSTFQDKMKELVKCRSIKRRLHAKIEYAKFLQETVKEMAKEVQNSRSGETKKTAEDLAEFLNKVCTISVLYQFIRSVAYIRRFVQYRSEVVPVSNEEILGFAKLFNDELTVDNISRPRLVNTCKYMGISSIGTDAYLRYMLRKRLQRIKNDDKLIQAEGVESLSEAELREGCRERGMLGVLSVDEMRQQLRDWLDLSLNHSVPSSLLILSRKNLSRLMNMYFRLKNLIATCIFGYCTKSPY
ncbi:LETM1-like protein, partial [Striga hermonthica]